MREARRWQASFWLSGTLAMLLLVAAVGGLLIPGVYRDTPGWAAQARGVNLVDLFGALPTLVASMVLGARGSRRARIVWLGVLGSVVYNAAIFAFAIAFNHFFLVYVANLGLAVFALEACRHGFLSSGFSHRPVARAQRRSVSLYLLIVAAFFLLAWMAEIIPSLISDTTPQSIRDAGLPTNPVYVLDLSLLLPLYVLAAVWLLPDQGRGFVLAGALLVFNVLNMSAGGTVPMPRRPLSGRATGGRWSRAPLAGRRAAWRPAR